MARQGRLHVPHGTYFVVDRFDPRTDLLAPGGERRLAPAQLRDIGENRRQFERLLGYLARRWCARVHAYCWLPRSALLLVRIGDSPLERIMHTLRGRFSAYLRGKGRAAGSPYRGRYAALLIDPDDYLLDVARHIFWSPVRAGLSRTPLGYEASSVLTCLGEPDPAALCDDTIAEALRMRGLTSRLGSRRFLTEPPSPGFLRLLAHGSRLDRRIAGSSAFVRRMTQSAERQRAVVPRDAVIAWAGRLLAIDPAEIRGHPRLARSVEGRALVAWLATCAGTATLAEVAQWFGCDPSTLHRALDRYSVEHPAIFAERTVRDFASSMLQEGLAGPPRKTPR